MPTVKVYTTPTCPWCKKTKDWLKEHKVKFKELNVIDDDKAREKMIEISDQTGVPVVEIGDNVIVGYDTHMMKKLLKIK